MIYDPIDRIHLYVFRAQSMVQSSYNTSILLVQHISIHKWRHICLYCKLMNSYPVIYRFQGYLGSLWLNSAHFTNLFGQSQTQATFPPQLLCVCVCVCTKEWFCINPYSWIVAPWVTPNSWTVTHRIGITHKCTDSREVYFWATPLTPLS
jgi:hypothetical protein